MSTLATIIGSLGELSESELRQLYLVIGVRLGIPDVPSGGNPPGAAAGKASGGAAKGKKPSAKAKTSQKGNPSRKSQWANHPLYQEYSRLKKVVETQSKELKCSFNAVDTPERRAYNEAFIQWMEAKSSFRDRRSRDGKETGNASEDGEGSSEEEEEANQPPPQPKKTPAGANGSSSSAKPPGSTIKDGRAPAGQKPGSGKAPAK